MWLPGLSVAIGIICGYRDYMWLSELSVFIRIIHGYLDYLNGAFVA